jgi:cytidyltransferase-like protein
MKAIVFGVFDGLHEGHKSFLRQAASKCDQLTVVVTVPEIVQALKNRVPKYSYADRFAAIQAFDKELKVVPSDAVLGEWSVLENLRPDMVFLGYDQQAIATELEKLGVPFTFLTSHEPERYKSSILHAS